MTLNELVSLYRRDSKKTIDHLIVQDLDKSEEEVFNGTPAEFMRSRRKKSHDSKVVSFSVVPRFSAHFELPYCNEYSPLIHHVNTGVEIFVVITHL